MRSPAWDPISSDFVVPTVAQRRPPVRAAVTAALRRIIAVSDAAVCAWEQALGASRPGRLVLSWGWLPGQGNKRGSSGRSAHILTRSLSPTRFRSIVAGVGNGLALAPVTSTS